MVALPNFPGVFNDIERGTLASSYRRLYSGFSTRAKKTVILAADATER
jgi:hypothetical protein